MRLISNTAMVQQRYGFDPLTQLLAPGIRLDDPKMVTPIVAEMSQGSYLLAREQEAGNLAALGVAASDICWFEQYVSLNSMLTGSSAFSSLGEAVRTLAGDQLVTVSGDLPYGRYLQLSKALGDQLSVETSAQPNVDAASVAVYRVSAAEVLHQFERMRTRGVPIAKKIVESRPHLAGLESDLGLSADTRFSTLDATLDELGATAGLCASPPNVSELTGARPLGDTVVLYSRGSDSIYLLAPSTQHLVEGEFVGIYRTLPEAVKDLGGSGALAVEEGWLSTTQTLQLRKAGVTVFPASAALSRWREVRDHEDLSFAIIAAQASRYCIEGAIQYAQKSLDAGQTVTETDVYNHYLELIHEFRSLFGITFSIEPFFANCHAADRTTYPALPVDHPLTESTKTLKFDSGLKVKVNGVVMGTSDMARTLVRSEEGREAYALFTKIVREELIPNLRPGTVCSEVHHDCVNRILDRQQQLTDLGLLPQGVDFRAGYQMRNVGHLMGKQESFTTEFRPGDEHRLTIGSVGAAEIQWPYRDHSIAAEDLWYVGGDRTYVTSV